MGMLNVPRTQIIYDRNHTHTHTVSLLRKNVVCPDLLWIQRLQRFKIRLIRSAVKNLLSALTYTITKVYIFV